MPPSATPKPLPQIIGFGEALFDVIGNEAILGGAPSNFAVHVNQLLKADGCSAAVVSRVGDDVLGRRLQAELAARGVDLRWLQVDAAAPTGTVQVELDAHGHPTYDICRNVAWDRIEFTPELAQLAAKAKAICYGTLVQRTAVSRETLYRCLDAAPQAMRVCDLNLRAPHHSVAVIEQSLLAATVLKLNDDELNVLVTAINLDAPANGISGQLVALTARYPNLRTIAVTRGAAGACLFHAGTHVEASSSKITFDADADTVGAGDAWCAALVVGLINEIDPQAIVSWANDVAGHVASKRGGTPSLPSTLLAPSPRRK